MIKATTATIIIIIIIVVVVIINNNIINNYLLLINFIRFLKHKFLCNLGDRGGDGVLVTILGEEVTSSITKYK